MKTLADSGTARQGLGRLGEELAARHLCAQGYALVERNVRLRAGEIDIVAREGACWAFVEVRCRRGARFGRPEETFTARKRTRVLQAALEYLDARGLGNAPWRVDFVAVELSPGGKLLRVELTRSALQDGDWTRLH